MAKTLTITITLDEEQDEFEPEYVHLNYAGLEISGDLTEEQKNSLAEGWAQSDWFYTDFTADIINALY